MVQGHPGWRRCSFVKMSQSSGFAIGAPRSGILASYFVLGTLALRTGERLAVRHEVIDLLPAKVTAPRWRQR
jgi:hypothetical protein